MTSTRMPCAIRTAPLDAMKPGGVGPRKDEVIVAFDAVARAWMTDAAASACHVPLPLLDGDLLVDIAIQLDAREASGQPARRLVAAMLLPGSVHDIVRMIRFSHEQGIAMTGSLAADVPGAMPSVRVRRDPIERQRPVLRLVRED